MAKAVFTVAQNSSYEDLRENWYHFPKTYLAQASLAIDDWVLLYEPRRTGVSGAPLGSQAYIAVARVTGIRPDSQRANHYFANLSDYIDFDYPVPFKLGQVYLEAGLQKSDGSTNKGAFGRSVRNISDLEFKRIVDLGFTESIKQSALTCDVEQGLSPLLSTDSRSREVVSRSVRDISFRENVRSAYGNQCAVTRMCITNRIGTPEVEAAHIRAVSHSGPDSIRNGISLSRSIHWMFDNGLFSIDEEYRLLVNEATLPPAVLNLFPDDGRILLLAAASRPHQSFMHWHRTNVFVPQNSTW